MKLKINTGILGLDPNRTDPNDADPRYPDRPGLNSPILGVYTAAARGDSGPTATNLFVPGKYTDTGKYGVIRIENDKLPFVDPPTSPPTKGVADWSSMFVKVSTWGVDGVYTKSVENSNVSYPRRINYFREPEWMSGVITGSWNGPGAGRPASPASANDYAVTPDSDPNAAHMRSVVGVFLPQLMSGTVFDSTHVVPADASRIGMVLGVFALSNQQGARYNDMHVDPANPGAMTFVSAVYAVNTMFGTPVDSKHINPDNAGNIRRVLSVKIPPSATEILRSARAPVDAGRHGDHPQG